MSINLYKDIKKQNQLHDYKIVSGEWFFHYTTLCNSTVIIIHIQYNIFYHDWIKIDKPIRDLKLWRLSENGAIAESETYYTYFKSYYL